MLTAVKDIGEFIINKQGKELLHVLVQNPNAGGNYTKVAVILFEQTDTEIQYQGVEVEEFDPDKINRYLYRRGTPRGANFSPGALLTDQVEKTFDTKILRWYTALFKKKNLPITKEEKTCLKDMENLLKINRDDMIVKIKEFRDKIPKKQGIFITFKIKKNGQWLYLGQIDVFKKLLQYQVNEKDLKLSSQNRICSICGEQKETVIGNLNTYKFYTLDKPGFISGGFNEKNAWKNFPVCLECKLAIEEGRKYIEKELIFQFFGIWYQLIPRFIWQEEKIIEETLEGLKEIANKINVQEEKTEGIRNNEEELLSVLKDMNDRVTFDLLFLQKSHAAERILLLVGDVTPSYLRSMFYAKKEVESEFGEPFSFRTVRNFFMKSDENSNMYDLDKYFLDISNKMFKGQPIDIHFLIRFLMMKIRSALINDTYFHFVVRDGRKVISFLYRLQLIEMEVDLMENTMNNRAFDELFEQYGPSFATPLKRGLILLGSLNELLLRKQYSLRDAKPYMKYLKSLRMTERDFKGLLPKVQSKLEEYGSFDEQKRLLAKEAANYLLLSGDNWKMSTDELNFYFAAGMNLVDEVCDVIYQNTEQNE
jgi:CRISPR-associated protein Csh1